MIYNACFINIYLLCQFNSKLYSIVCSDTTLIKNIHLHDLLITNIVDKSELGSLLVPCLGLVPIIIIGVLICKNN